MRQDNSEPATVVVTGAGGQLGSYLRPALEAAGYAVVGVGHRRKPGVDLVADLSSLSELQCVLNSVRFDAIIHAAAFTDVDGCERDPVRARQVNHIGSRNMALLAKERHVWLVGVSTDFVFDGTRAPYAEDDEPNPISEYGRSKLAGDTEILDVDHAYAVARTSWVYGGSGKHFPRTVLSTVTGRGAMDVVEDEVSSPTFARDLANALLLLLEQRPSGIFHLTSSESVSRYHFAREVVRIAGLNPECVQPTSTAAFLEKFPLPAKRPAESTLVNTRASSLGVTLPHWQTSLETYVPQLVQEISGENSRVTEKRGQLE